MFREMFRRLRLRISGIPDMSAWSTNWKFTPQPDITAKEVADILASFGRMEVAVKPDDPTFAPFKRHFVQIGGN